MLNFEVLSNFLAEKTKVTNEMLMRKERTRFIRVKAQYEAADSNHVTQASRVIDQTNNDVTRDEDHMKSTVVGVTTDGGASESGMEKLHDTGLLEGKKMGKFKLMLAPPPSDQLPLHSIPVSMLGVVNNFEVVDEKPS